MSEHMGFPHSEQVGMLYSTWNVAIRTIHGENLHCGYWVDENDQSSLQEAQDHLTDLISEQLSVTPGSRLLDAGCGVGESALRIARSTAAFIVGIDVAHVGLEIATEKARSQLLSDRLTFQYADMTNMPFEPGSFDGVYAIESLCHILDRADAFREIYRVLKPGGRFVFSDPFICSTPSQQDSLVEALWHGAFVTLDYLTESLQTTGFTELELLDLTDNVKRSIPLWQHNCASFINNNKMKTEEFDKVIQAIEADCDNTENGSRYFLITACKPA